MKDGARFTARRFRLPVGIDPGERSAGAAEAAIIEDHIHLDRRIAAAVENLAGNDVGDVGHGGLGPAARAMPPV